MKKYEAVDLAPDTYEGEYYQPSVPVYKVEEVDAEISKLQAERERLRKALQEIKEELEYDISNGKVALDLALGALEDK